MNKPIVWFDPETETVVTLNKMLTCKELTPLWFDPKTHSGLNPAWQARFFGQNNGLTPLTIDTFGRFCVNSED